MDARLRRIGPPVPKRILTRIVEGLPALGVDPAAPLSRLGLSVDALKQFEDGDLRWSFLHDFWEAVREVTGQSGLGLRLGEQASLQYYEVFGPLVERSATLGDALFHATRFFRLVLSSVEIELYVEGDRAQLAYRSLSPETFHAEEAEFLAAAIGAVARKLAGTDLEALEVRFAHDAPADLTCHRRLLGRSRLRFNSPHNALVFDSAILNIRLRASDDAFTSDLRQEAERRVRMRNAVRFSRVVEDAIRAELCGGNPSARHVAERLGLHPKTLSRKLKAEGTKFQDLLAQVRHRLAESYLCNPEVSVEQVAMRLGYSSASSFGKAFRRWAGAAPRQYLLPERIDDAATRS